MFESGYYPPGAEFDPNAPYNEVEPVPVLRYVEYSSTMRCTAAVGITDYNPGWDADDDDFSDTDWMSEFKGEYRSPDELIAQLKDIAGQLAGGVTPRHRAGFWRQVIKDCDNWTVEDEYAEQV